MSSSRDGNVGQSTTLVFWSRLISQHHEILLLLILYSVSFNLTPSAGQSPYISNEISQLYFFGLIQTFVQIGIIVGTYIYGSQLMYPDFGVPLTIPLL